MKFLTLLLYIALVAAVLTGIIGGLKKGHKSWLMTFLQNFTGVLFIVSGFVKAVDPMGTAFKMEQYFTFVFHHHDCIGNCCRRDVIVGTQDQIDQLDILVAYRFLHHPDRVHFPDGICTQRR